MSKFRKYHKHARRVTALKVPLYNKARFDDTRERLESAHKPEASFENGWVFTNIRFLDDALQFGTCAGLHL